MKTEALFTGFLLFVLLNPASAAGVAREASLTGLAGNGTCVVEVSVDGAAEVEISGSMGYLTTLSGEPALWRRFQCNAPLPRDPAGFQLASVEGRGFVRLVRDPRFNGGRALIRIDDPNRGRGRYTFNLEWRDPRGGAWPHPNSVLACQDSVADRLYDDGYSQISFDRTLPGSWPSRPGWVSGTVKAARSREFDGTWFVFSCLVDGYGQVRSVDLRRR